MPTQGMCELCQRLWDYGINPDAFKVCEIQRRYEPYLNGESVTITGVMPYGIYRVRGSSIKADRIIFNDPATIVIWEDGSKTVVKAHGADKYNPLTGVALCYMKKALGNTSRKLNDALKDAERYYK